jgi:type VI secretion system protein ImpL
VLAYLLAAVVLVVAALLAFGLAALLHLQGAAYAIFVTVILLIGIAAAVVIVVMHLRSKKQKELEGAVAEVAPVAEIDLLIDDANRKLKASPRAGKTLDALPLIYVLGEAGSAKTTTVMQSGFEPELVTGTASHESAQPPTQSLNLWFTGSAALLEIGSSIRANNAALARLVHRTRARAIRSAFGKGAAPRAVIVCLSMDQLLTPDGGQTALTSARTSGAQLRELSRMLGMPVPVYVIVTRTDRVSHFEEFVRNLSDDEVRQVLGIPLARVDATAGTYTDQAGRMLSPLLDGLAYKLGEFRLEMLDRENDPGKSPGVYEFPREFGKLRKNLNQYLVELCKPSQLSANPYLRGFYFTGIRARVVERAVNGSTVAEAPVAQEAGATQFLNLSRVRAEQAARVAAPVMVATRVPQWTFLPRLIPEVILGDSSALTSTLQSAPARLFRRILYGALALFLSVYVIFLVVSYFKNAALEHRVADAAGVLSKSTAAIAGPAELRAFDDLRQQIVLLDDYRAHGAPLALRFGLYHGNKIDDQARRVYFERFRTLMLNPTQVSFLAYLRALPDAPATSSDFGSYTAAYKPLKAYLITTSNPEKSQPQFLTPVFLQYWMGQRNVDPDQQQLAQRQIDFYGNELLRQPPYNIAPESGTVEHARGYLSHFLATTRIYQGMLADADKTAPAIEFNKNYPGAAPLVTNSHIVRGAFTKNGFNFMQDAIQHPEKYAQGETWVLGAAAGESLNAAAITKELSGQYSSDFLKEWHEFLINARVGSCGTLKEAPTRLNQLSGPASPLLELFYTVSHNTAVSDPAIKNTFQPAQALVDPNATERLIGGGNAAYITALSQLAGAVDLVAQNPAAATDAALFAPVSQQVVAANGAAQQAAQQFNVDQQMHTEQTVLSLMQAPIQCVGKLAPSPGAAANGGGQKLCASISPLLAKFPFSPASQSPASLQEVDAVFAPDTGALWTTYGGILKPYLMQQGAQFVPAPASPQPVNPRFAQYFNRAAHVSSELYPAAQKSASFPFSLRFIPGGGVSSGTLVVDGARIAPGATSQQFTWTGASAQHASLVYDNNEALQFQGTWSLFQLVRTAKISRAGGGYRLDYLINTATTVAGHTVGGSGAEKTVSFELSGQGADLLAGDGFSGLNCVAPVVK